MSDDIADIVVRLAENAEAVCRYYLPAGRREGRQWRVGDVGNAPGRSLYVRLTGPLSGCDATGRWRDAATGQSGDLLDLIKAARGLPSFADVLAEARRFLNLPPPQRRARRAADLHGSDQYDAMRSIRRLLAESMPIKGTLAQVYLHNRGIDCRFDLDPLRYHPHCPYRDPDTGRFRHWPAMLAIVSDLDGKITGLQRTYLSRDGRGKAPLAVPRRSMGAVWTHGVRFGDANDLAVFGEGVETVLSLKRVLPIMPMVATLSADNLGTIALPATLRRIYIAVDNDAAGIRGAAALLARARSAGIEATLLTPLGGDFNVDLVQLGADAIRRCLQPRLRADDRQLVADSVPASITATCIHPPSANLA